MKIIERPLLEIDYGHFKKRTALLSDVKETIKEDCVIKVDGEPVLIYKILPAEDLKHLRWAVKNIQYTTGERVLGLKSISKTFGFSPRLTVRYDFCRLSGMGFDEPKQHQVISDFGKKMVEIYKEYMPDQFNFHEEIVKEKVMGEWTIDGTPFTSGIVNKNNPLKYHTDSGNFKGVLSNMVVLKRDVDGGYLIIPELDIALECPDGALVIFNGQKLLHGVSPIEYNNDMSYRYSVVFYSLEQMWKCEPIDDELIRIRNVKTEREIKRIDPEHIKELGKHYNK